MDFLLILPVLLFSVIIHEVAHGWVALRQGDATAYMLGRLTLNPIPHIDPFGSIVVPLVMALPMLTGHGGGPILGWAKPVPVNPRNYRNYRRGDILVSLAGIAANVVLAVLFTLLIVATTHMGRALPALVPTLELLQRMFWWGVNINLVLAFFNLIPIPPLDGSHVFYYLLPPKLGYKYRQIGQMGILLVLLLLLFFPPVTAFFLWPAGVLQHLALNFIQVAT